MGPQRTPTSADHGAIAGRVTTTAGEPVPEAAVMLAGSSPAHRDIAALTAEDGEFRFDDLVPGTYQVMVNAAGADPRTETVRVSPGRVSRLDVSIGA